MGEVAQKGKLAKQASVILNQATTKDKNEALQLIAKELRENQTNILLANKHDIQLGRERGLSEAILDRIRLDEGRLEDIVNSIEGIIDLTDPIGEVIETRIKDNGLTLQRVCVPIGVIGIIYEARPNVTADATVLALKTNNAVVLRGSSSALYSNQAIVQSIHEALRKSPLPKDAVQLIEGASRDQARRFFQLDEYLDVLIPRGSEQLIELVKKEATVPIIETGAGNCHLLIDQSAKVNMAYKISENAKLQRPSVCNAIETLLIHEAWFEKHGKQLLEFLCDRGVLIYGDENIRRILPDVKTADEKAWTREYLSNELSVKVVRSLEEAIAHINTYGTKHSEAIVTEDLARAEKFLQQVDASSVYHNASTRFTDGFEFGYGAEIGISTQKLHARGPMGLEALTSSKFIIKGVGQIRQ